MTNGRKKELIRMANGYADMAISEGTSKASRALLADHSSGRMNNNEHIAVILLVQRYIDCKCGELSRDDCLKAQEDILR